MSKLIEEELIKEYYEDEEHILEMPLACKIECNDDTKTCITKCMFAKISETESPFAEYSSFVEELTERELGKFNYSSPKEIFEKAKKLSNKANVNVTVKLQDIKALVKDSKVIGGIGNEKLLRKILHNPECKIIKHEKHEFTICLEKNILDNWKKDINDYPQFAISPPTLVSSLLFYDYVDNETPEWECMETGVAGEYREGVMQIVLNETRYWNEINNAIFGLRKPKDVVKEIVHTALHEKMHELDDLNKIEYKGSWAGALGFGIITGVPMPTGSELEAEEKAELLLKVNEEFAKDVFKKFEEKVKQDMQNLLQDEKTRKTVEYIQKFNKFLKKKLNLDFDMKVWTEGPNDNVYLIYTIYHDEDNKQWFDYLVKLFGKRFLKAKEEGIWQETEEMEVQAFKQLFEEFKKKEGDPPIRLEITDYTEGGFITTKKPAFEIPEDETSLTIECIFSY